MHLRQTLLICPALHNRGQLLVQREEESSTVLTPNLAIPHIIIDGEKTFDVLLVRARGGICFSDAAPCVHAIFVLVGTRDERNFHLRALAAIAQIVQDLLKAELEFNRKAGFTNKDDRLPEMFYKEPLPPHNKVVVISDEEMDKTFDF